MEYPRNDEEFYNLMEKKREEINLLNVPESKKKELHSLLEETITRHEEQKKLNLKENLEKLFTAWGELYAINVKIVSDIIYDTAKRKAELEKARKTIGEKFADSNPGMMN